MDLYRTIEGLLKNYDGTISFYEAVDTLEAEYSEKTISKFLKDNKKYFEFDGETITSFQVKIDIFLNELKALIEKYKLSIEDIWETVFEVLGFQLHKQLKNKKRNKQNGHQPAERWFFNELDQSSKWNKEFFSTPEKQYVFTSQLFEFLLTEEFGEYGIYTTPESIISLIGKLLPNKAKINLYNPTSGFLNLTTALTLSTDAKMKIKASELNASIYEYGKLFAEINNVKAEYSCTDSCEEIIELPTSKYDVILANLPFAVIQTRPFLYDRKYSELSLHIISESLRKLAKNGRAFFLVNDGVLFSLTNEKVQFRKEIVDSKMLKAVISLPSKILPQSSVKTSLLVFENTTSTDSIQFIDASEGELVTINPDKTISLKTKKISSLLNWDIADNSPEVQEPLVQYGKNDHKLSISISDIQARDYDLSSGKYIAEQDTYGDDYVPLHSVLKPQKTSVVSEAGEIPFIRISDLNSKLLDDISNVGFNTTTRKGKRINKPSILIGTVGESFKPTLYEGKFDIEVSSNIAIFEFDQDMVFAPYLVQELNADYARKQMNLLSKGSAMKHISVNDILSVRVKLPPLDEQKRIFSTRIEFTNSHGLTNKTEDKTISDANIFETFKHEIGNILKGPEGFFDLLPQFFTRHKIDLDTPIVETEPDTIGEMMQMSTAKINQVFDVMENMEGILFSDVEYFKPSTTELKPFIEKCLRQEVTSVVLI